MSKKSYIFDYENIINLLLNHKRYISLKAQELMTAGRDIRHVKQSETRYWTEQFFKEEIARGELKTSDIFDDIEDILKKTTGETINEYAKRNKGH